jgi:activator of HSP90 ATPase
MVRRSEVTEHAGKGGEDLSDAVVPKQAFTRRKMIDGMAIMGLGSLAIAVTPAAASSAYISIHQEVDLMANPARIYEALMDEKQFSAFTRGAAHIQREAGGEFKLFGEMPGIRGVTGRNVELVPNERIVQAWRASEWPSGVYSIVRFELTAYGPATRIVFDQAGLAPIPPTTAWSHMYWEPLRKYLNG